MLELVPTFYTIAKRINMQDKGREGGGKESAKWKGDEFICSHEHFRSSSEYPVVRR